jgi:hypothetical protein
LATYDALRLPYARTTARPTQGDRYSPPDDPRLPQHVSDPRPDGRIPILYFAPWVGYAGSDTGTIDWQMKRGPSRGAAEDPA